MGRQACRSARTLGALALGLALGTVPAGARAQFAPPAGAAGASGMSRVSGGATLNPFANPYANPYLNPLMTQQEMTPGQAALYFMAAQQATGGLGSGRLGGPRAGSGPRAAAEPAAEPRGGTANVPGARASTFFNRTNPTASGAGTYYNRQIRSFPEKGR